MQNHMNVSAVSGEDRASIAESLYHCGGAADAALRCDINARYGKFDMVAELIRKTRLRQGHYIADIGCGSGQHLQAFADIVGEAGRAWGFDFSEAAVEATKKRGLNAELASGEAIPLADQSLDAMTCNYAIYYMPDLHRVMTEWFRLLKPSGRLVITGPSAETNEELYRFHLEATGQHPSDADLMALGYIENTVALRLHDFDMKCESMDFICNPIIFPDNQVFLQYWRSSSLFARTVPENLVEQALRFGESLLKNRQDAFTVTKKITILTVSRSR